MTEEKIEELQKNCYELEKYNCEPFTFYKAGYEQAYKEYSEQPCTSCCITDSLEQSLDEINYELVNLTGQNKLLLAQIEKMKNCKNCSYGINGGCDYYNAVPDSVQNCGHWQMINQ